MSPANGINGKRRLRWRELITGEWSARSSLGEENVVTRDAAKSSLSRQHTGCSRVFPATTVLRSPVGPGYAAPYFASLPHCNKPANEHCWAPDAWRHEGAAARTPQS